MESEMHSSQQFIALAIDGNAKSKYVVSWALDKFVPAEEGDHVFFKLLHVRPLTIRVPTPMGNFIPIAEVRDDVAVAFRKEMEWKRNEMLLPYKKMCTGKKVPVEIVQVESDDVVQAIVREVARCKINKLVIGTSSRHLLSRGKRLSSKISQSCPRFCTVYVISKGKLSSVRPAESETSGSPKDGHRNSSFSTSTSSRHDCSSYTGQRVDKISSCLTCSDISRAYTAASSFRSLQTHNQPCKNDQFPDADLSANPQLDNLHNRRLEEAVKFREIVLKEEEAKESAKEEKEKCKAAKREAEYVIKCAERETAQKRGAEAKALHESKEKEMLKHALEGHSHQYQEFTWEEIVMATSSFSVNLRIGMGSYGAVYKGNFHHTSAAVKILHSKDGYRLKQFHQELEVLSKIRHPHLLSLLGACAEHGCLIYEFMENGSLEECLLKKNNSWPLPWYERCRIAWEVSSALVYLHNSKPKLIIHRDLKPANILLDHNLVSKIGDVGLSTMQQSDSSTLMSDKNSGLVGTFCYIDPEYQRTGILSPKSDVYAFGMVMLQLLTAKSAMGLAHLVEKAVENDSISNVLDQDAGGWPVKETMELALLALRCTELRSQDRPHLKDEILPILEKVKEVADKARDCAPILQPIAPNHFICPILKEVMEDPCVAADGYTYEQKAIEVWLEENDKSPMTNLTLPHKNLLPNHTLLSVITQWKSQNH